MRGISSVCQIHNAQRLKNRWMTQASNICHGYRAAFLFYGTVNLPLVEGKELYLMNLTMSTTLDFFPFKIFPWGADLLVLRQISQSEIRLQNIMLLENKWKEGVKNEGQCVFTFKHWLKIYFRTERKNKLSLAGLRVWRDKVLWSNW